VARWTLPSFIRLVYPFPYQPTIDSGTSTHRPSQPAWTLYAPSLVRDWIAALDTPTK
jgi:hypothetical protein